MADNAMQLLITEFKILQSKHIKQTILLRDEKHSKFDHRGVKKLRTYGGLGGSGVENPLDGRSTKIVGGVPSPRALAWFQ
jgi:hypothetical protein